MSHDELLPCPFCGGSANLIEYPPHSHSYALVGAIGIADHPGSWAAECQRCGCGLIYNTADEAITSWNRRSTPPVGAETGEPVATKRLTDKDMRDGMPCEWPACGCDFDAKCSDAPPRSDKANGDWVLVPREPTEAMIEAGRWPAEDDGPLACYRAMIAVSPASPAEDKP